MESRTLILALSFLMWLYSQIGICAKPESFVQTGHTSYVRTIAFSPDGKFIISGGGDKTARLWNVATGIEIRTFEGHKSDLTSVAFSPDASMFFQAKILIKRFTFGTLRAVIPSEYLKGLKMM